MAHCVVLTWCINLINKLLTFFSLSPTHVNSYILTDSCTQSHTHTCTQIAAGRGRQTEQSLSQSRNTRQCQHCRAHCDGSARVCLYACLSIHLCGCVYVCVFRLSAHSPQKPIKKQSVGLSGMLLLVCVCVAVSVCAFTVNGGV